MKSNDGYVSEVLFTTYVKALGDMPENQLDILAAAADSTFLMLFNSLTAMTHIQHKRLVNAIELIKEQRKKGRTT